MSKLKFILLTFSSGLSLFGFTAYLFSSRALVFGFPWPFFEFYLSSSKSIIIQVFKPWFFIFDLILWLMLSFFLIFIFRRLIVKSIRLIWIFIFSFSFLFILIAVSTGYEMNFASRYTQPINDYNRGNDTSRYYSYCKTREGFFCNFSIICTNNIGSYDLQWSDSTCLPRLRPVSYGL